MTLARLRRIFARKVKRGYETQREIRWWCRVYGDTRSRHGRLVRARKAWLVHIAMVHARILADLRRKP